MIHTERYLSFIPLSFTRNVNLMLDLLDLTSYCCDGIYDVHYYHMLVSSVLNWEGYKHNLDTSPNLELPKSRGQTPSFIYPSIFSLHSLLSYLILQHTYHMVRTIDRCSSCHIQTYCLIHIQPIISAHSAVSAKDTWLSRLIYPFMQGSIVYL